MARRGPNEGSFRERRPGLWEARLTLGHDGRGRRLSRSFYGRTRAEVRAKLDEAHRAHAQGLPLPAERLTVGAYLEGWLVAVRPTIRPTTYVSYAGHVRRHIAPTLGRISLARLTPQDVRRLLAARLAAGLSARTVEYIHAVLRRALGGALRDGLVARNVATLVDPPRVRRHEIRPLTPDEARHFLEAIRGDRLEALYTVALACGLRQGEALGLRWEDVDVDAGTLTVRTTLQQLPRDLRPDGGRRGTRYALAEPKTARSRRTVILPGVVVAALREHRRRQRVERLVAGHRWRGEDWRLVFTTTIGTPLDSRNVTTGFQRVLAREGLPRQRFHDLRHACATLLLAQGVDPRTIMETLGHSTIGMTMNVYAHVLPALQRDAADRMDALLRPLSGAS